MDDSVKFPRTVYQDVVAQGNSRNHFGHVFNYAPTKTRRNMLKESLYFDEMHHPRELETFPGTYEWMFHNATNSFPDWARSYEKIFWVTGKAGSGKSTLMKFLSEQQRTRKLLQEWAGHDEIVIANFFFWNAGNKMQKSQLGLMRSLLYQIINHSENVSLDAVAEDRRTTDENAWQRPWTRKDLSKALSSLLVSLPTSRHYCLFVDGLDEYELDNADEGNYDDLVEYLNTLAESPLVKLCVSSRPWNVFMEAYEKVGRYRITMHELTQNDMSIFIEARIAEDARFAGMLSKGAAAASLITTIRNGAEGVFLWVALAIKDIRRGLCEHDDLETLRRRVEQLPKELDVFLERMFQSIDAVYEIYAARTLLTALHGELYPSMQLLEYSFLEELVRHPNSAVSAKGRRLPFAEAEARIQNAEASINKWCKDLLQVGWGKAVRGDVWYGMSTTRVHFPHRSIADFVRRKDESGLLRDIVGKDFTTAKGKLEMTLHVLKISPDKESMLAYGSFMLRRFRMDFERRNVDYIDKFEDFDHFMTEHLQVERDVHWSSNIRSQHSHSPEIYPIVNAGHSAVSLAFRYRLYTLASSTYNKDPYGFNTSQLHTMLGMGLLVVERPTQLATDRNLEIVHAILQRQVLPEANAATMVYMYGWPTRKNYIVQHYSVWQLFLASLTTVPERRRAGNDPVPSGILSATAQVWCTIVGIFKRFLDLGADPDTVIEKWTMTTETLYKLQRPVGGTFSFSRPAMEVFSDLQRVWSRSRGPYTQILARRYEELSVLLEQASKARKAAAMETSSDRHYCDETSPSRPQHQYHLRPRNHVW